MLADLWRCDLKHQKASEEEDENTIIDLYMM